MKKLLLPLLLLLFTTSYAQQSTQYFDGADTSAWNSLQVIVPPDTVNPWQIGTPQKALFNSAYTVPNAIVTDTVNLYSNNDTSSFSYDYWPQLSWGILALRWAQKLDIDTGDIAIVEYKASNDSVWHNIFNNPLVYNFYGFEPANIDTVNGRVGFSFTDTLWRDIWLCFDYSFLQQNGFDTITIKYTFITDSGGTPKEGWMIDNLMASVTFLHTINENDQTTYIKAYPNPSADFVYIETKKRNGFHIIEDMLLRNIKGEVVQEWHNIPTKYFIDVRNLPVGQYSLHIKTNIKTEDIPLIIAR